MRVFKFGGASVKDAVAVRNVLEVLKLYSGQKLIVVISAMGKTTNSLEEILKFWFEGNPLWENSFAEFVQFHENIAEDLSLANQSRLQRHLDDLRGILNESPEFDFDEEYDRIVCFGELLSTTLVNDYLNDQDCKALWLDVRDVIQTNSKHRDAEVNWKETQGFATLLNQAFQNSETDIIITQGFIARDSEGKTTTLGREGSDYSAAILAYVTDAESVTIWKDVPGMLNADPSWFNNTVKLEKISYREAIELSYYGASVIHPKTIQPLQNKEIPLEVKSFLNPKEEGSLIQRSSSADNEIPSFIFKPGQWLISVSTVDFSFIVEEHLSQIFDALAAVGLKMNMMQNSAISFSFCVEGDERKVEALKAKLGGSYSMKYNTDLELLTIRHYTDLVLDQLTSGREILLEQRSRTTVRMLLKKSE